MTKKVTKLTGYQRKALRALLTAPNVTAASEQCGITRKTIYTYLADPDFCEALAAAESEAISEAARRIAGAATKAVNVFLDIIDDPDSTPWMRKIAADSILTHLPKLRLLGSLEQAIKELQDANNQPS